jgi:hypothetical protein
MTTFEWVPQDKCTPSSVLLVHRVLTPEEAEVKAMECFGTGFMVFCDKHWGTGAPDEWIVMEKDKGTIGSFPTKSDAMTFAETTYEIQAA